MTPLGEKRIIREQFRDAYHDYLKSFAYAPYPTRLLYIFIRNPPMNMYLFREDARGRMRDCARRLIKWRRKYRGIR